MIVVDTNVISELWRRHPDPRVLAWIDAQLIETLYLSVVTIVEIRFGIETMPEGPRKAVYQERLAQQLLPAFSGRILVFDLDAACICADMMAKARRAGKVLGKADAFIAATARARGMQVATRDVSPFLATGLDVIDPWQYTP